MFGGGVPVYVDTREDTAVLDELDFDPKCQEFGECDQQATHKCVWSCGCLWMLCADHAEIVARANGAVLAGIGVWFCPECSIRPLSLVALERI